MGNDFLQAWNAAWRAAEMGFRNSLSNMKGAFSCAVGGMKSSLGELVTKMNAVSAQKQNLTSGSESVAVKSSGILDRIPFLAQGGIVTQPTVALIGERGQEAVLPLSNNTGWMDELAYKLSVGLAAANPAQATNGGVVSLNIDGTAFAEAVIEDFARVADRQNLRF